MFLIVYASTYTMLQPIMNMGLHYQDGITQLRTLASVRRLVLLQLYPPILGMYLNWHQTPIGHHGSSLSL